MDSANITEKHRKIMILSSSLIAIGIGSCGVVHFFMNHDSKPPADQISVVSATMPEAPHIINPSSDVTNSAKDMLSSEDANQLIIRNLPQLREVHSECDTDICIVSAQPLAAGAPLDDQALSRLVKEDMPHILMQAGHGLLEPIQIEELGPDQYRLRFRIPRQPQ